MAKTHKKIAKGATLMQRSTLYDAGDHLLQVKGSFQEEYRRFFYRDIEAVLVYKNNKATTLSGLFFLVMVIATVLCYIAGDIYYALATVLTFLTLITAASVLPSIFAGGYCDCYISTRVQVEKIEALNNLRKVGKIKRLIAERAAELTPPVIHEAVPEPSTQASV